MITSPIALGIAVFFAIVTVAPKRPDFGESARDYLAIVAGAVIAAVFSMLAIAPL